MAGRQVPYNPFEDGDDAQFVKAKKHIKRGAGASGRAAGFTGGKKSSQKHRAKKMINK